MVIDDASEQPLKKQLRQSVVEFKFQEAITLLKVNPELFAQPIDLVRSLCKSDNPALLFFSTHPSAALDRQLEEQAVFPPTVLQVPEPQATAAG